MQNRLASYAGVIEAACPGLAIREIAFLDRQGQFNDVLTVNGELIFRFPRFVAGIQVLRMELEILDFLQGRLPLPIPTPQFSALDPAVPGQAFVGYSRLPGAPLTLELLQAIREGQALNRVAEQLGGFLRALHALPSGPLGSAWPVNETRTDWETLFSGVRDHLFPLMHADARAAVTALFESYFDGEANRSFVPSMRHGDFGTGNILIDLNKFEITGIIDFGFAGVGDPALDIAATMTLGDPFFERLAAAYPESAPMSNRARFYRDTFALQEALHGYLNDEPEALAHGMQDYV